MSKTKRILAFALAAVLAVVVLTGCKSIVQKVFGSSNEVQEDDTTQWAVLSSDPLMLDALPIPRPNTPQPGPTGR